MNGLQAHNMSQSHMNGLQHIKRDGQHDGQSLPSLSGAMSAYPPYSAGLSQHPQTSTASYPSSTQPQYSNGLPQLAPHQGHGMPMGSYSQPGGYANMTQSMMPPSSTSMVSNMPPTSSSRLPDLHPRPQDGGTLLAQLQQHGMPNPLLAPGQNPGDSEPTHVVGQQGRRGILPSAPGRGPANVRSTVPVKDADGKYPCPHCNKTYQHAKHLKRHLLRHTGDRPYMCKLCKDTFSRSDILKRHFQKCSVRRGVVGDMDHLEGSRAHLQKNRQSVDMSNQNIQFLNPSVNQSPVYGEGPNGMQGMPPSMMQQQPYGDMQSNSARNSRSNSLVRPNSFMDNRRSMSQLEQMNTSRPGDFQGYNAFSTPGGGLPSILPNGTHPGNGSATHSPVSAMPNGINGHGYSGFGAPDSFPQQVRKADLAQIGNPGWGNAYRSTPPSNATLDWVKAQQADSDQAQHLYSHKPHDSGFAGLYTDPSDFENQQDYGNWNANDSIDNKISSIISFCLAYTTTGSNQEELMLRVLLKPDNVQDFLAEYKNYQGHWPMLHMPTFDPMQASDALILAMICIGAVYSDKINISQTRWLMELAKHAVKSASADLLYEGQAVHEYSNDDTTQRIQALLLLQCLFLWHGTSSQRERARAEWPQFAVLARRCHLLEPLAHSSTDQISFLHQTSSTPYGSDSAWNWYAWIDSEKRARAFYIIYLIDCAMAIYFNAAPQFDPSEIKLRLPADDAAWEAPTADECARRMGLYGFDLQEGQNISGSRLASQPEFFVCLSALFDPAAPHKPRETNAYSKFILVHAIHAILWTQQRRDSPSTPTAALQGLRFSRSGASTPVSSAASTANSGSSTPVPSTSSRFAYSNLGLRGVKGALDKWKRSWDVDNDLQYSPSSNAQPQLERLPRVGFCRDGIYYYYLAVQFYNKLSRPTAASSSHSTGQQELWQLAPDTRFSFVMALVKQIKQWMHSEQGKPGRELDLGSMGHIDEKYGAAELTLDMSLLFTRIVPRTSAAAQRHYTDQASGYR